jgi:hypothetical protein
MDIHCFFVYTLYYVTISLSDQPCKSRTNVQWMNIHQNEWLDRTDKGLLNAAKQTKPNITATQSPTLHDKS